MSQLTTAEQAAGISRAALDVMKRKNGKRSNKIDASTSGSNKIDQPSLLRFIGDGTTELPIIQTPYRRLSVLESHDHMVIIRDACFVGSKCDVSLIHLDYHEAHALAGVLRDLEPPDEPKNGKSHA